MLYINASEAEKSISRADIWRLENILETSIAEYKEFLEQDDEERTFYEFFFEVLNEHNAITIDIEWEWEPEDFFWQLQEALSDRAITLVSSVRQEQPEGYEIEYTFDGATYKTVVPLDEPGKLIEVVSELLPDQQFMVIDFGEDRYSWVLAPRGMDPAEFCAVTGASLALPPWANAVASA